MESRTTDEMKEVAGTIARLITEQGKAIGVDECIVDDFGRYGNFSLLCYFEASKRIGGGYYPDSRGRFSLAKMVNLIKRTIKDHKSQGAKFRSHESPEYMVRYGSFNGYDKRYIFIDLDFIPYNQNINMFEGQTKYDGMNQEDSDQLKLNLQ